MFCVCFFVSVLYYCKQCEVGLMGSKPSSNDHIFLQCIDAVGWVIWPVKPSPVWPIMCSWRR